MKKLVIAFLLLIGAGAFGYYKFVVDKVVEKPTVNRAPITRGNILEVVQSTGTLEPTKTVQVGSQVSGVVKNMYVDFNSIVHEGMVLAEIDPELLKVQVKIQEANLAQRKGDIENQKVQLENDKKNLERQRSLFERGIGNQQALDSAELAVKSREAQITSQITSLQSLEANLAQARMNVDYTVIKSSVDGVVVNRLVDKGQTVQASLNTPQFFTIATDLRELKLSAGVDESEIGKVEAGQRVLFNVDAYPGQDFEGVVDRVRLNATNQNNVVTYPVWIKVMNPQLKLKPAMTANLRIVISTAENVLRVPNSALRWKPTNDIYTALGLEPPAAGRTIATEANNGANGDKNGPGGPRREGGQGAGGQQQARAGGEGGRQGGDRQANAQPGGTGGGFNRQPGSTGFGGGQTNLTPEQRQQFAERMASMGGGRGNGGRGGGGRQGGGRGGGGRSGVPTAPAANMTEAKRDLQGAKTIDELFEPIPRRETQGQLYTWDPEGGPNKKGELKQHTVRVGVTDGQFSELVRADGLDVNTMVVTGVVMPQTSANRPGQNNLFGNQPGRNPGGMTPAGPGGFGGGGGGGGRGGGGGGRGGGN